MKTQSQPLFIHFDRMESKSSEKLSNYYIRGEDQWKFHSNSEKNRKMSLYAEIVI